MLKNFTLQSLRSDMIASLIVSFVALPLCLGVAMAANAPLFSGVLAGIVGGIIVGSLSGSSVSVTGASPALTAVIASQSLKLGSFEAFLAAVVIAGILQVGLSIFKMGFISSLFPSNVIKGLLWAVGLLLILKQIPHLIGHDADPMGDDSFLQLNKKNTFTELLDAFLNFHYGAGLIGVFSIICLVAFDYVEKLKKNRIIAPMIVIFLSIWIPSFLSVWGDGWAISAQHLVQVPVAKSLKSAFGFLIFPDFSVLKTSSVYFAGLSLALVASLETLLNLEALDKIDPLKRSNPKNRELFAQGVGNIIGGCIGALPLASVIVRSSVNINSGARTSLSSILHGFILLFSVLLIPEWLNKIPLSALAAILVVTGWKLASPAVFKQLWSEGKYQFLPFILTVVAILFTDLLTGILIGLGIAICFILQSNIRRPIKKTMEKHATGYEVLHIELPNQVSFFNRVVLEKTLTKVPKGGHVLIDANNTDYIDPDILDLINDFQNSTAVHGVNLSLVGFKDKYPQLEDRIQYVDFTTRELQANVTPEKVLEFLKEGNIRFREGVRLTRNLERQLGVASSGQFPLAVILSCIDSRAPVELIFDLGIGDVFTIRIAGNVVSNKVIGSIEFASAIAGAKLVVVMGHTSCGAVKAAADFMCKEETVSQLTGCDNLDCLITDIQRSIDLKQFEGYNTWPPSKKENYLNYLAYKNVLHSIEQIRLSSPILEDLVQKKQISIVGGMYNISSAEVTFFYPSDDYPAFFPNEEGS